VKTIDFSFDPGDNALDNIALGGQFQHGVMGRCVDQC
jgi:hypothetical protein